MGLLLLLMVVVVVVVVGGGGLRSVPATRESISSEGWDFWDYRTCCRCDREVVDQTRHLIPVIVTPDQPVLALPLYRQAPDRAATRVPVFKSLV